VSFLADALDSLREQYRERGSELLLARGDLLAVLSRSRRGLRRRYGNLEPRLPGLASTRDRAVAAALADAGVSVDVERFGGTLLHEPEHITTNDGSHYPTSDFWLEWRDREKAAPVAAPVRGDVVDPRDSLDEEWFGEASETAGPLPSLAELGFDDPEADVQPAGTDAAHDLLADFREDTIYRYEDDREYPARESTSRLSPYLKFGTVGVRTVWEATEDAAAAASDGDSRSRSRRSGDSSPGGSSTRTFSTRVLTSLPRTTASTRTRSSGATIPRDFGRGRTARRAIRSSTPGCGSCATRRGFTIASGWWPPHSSRRTC